jgi:DNA mismatch endonuclease (patch repair protein)
MADIVDRATRSRMMAGIRGRNTKPELVVRSALHRLGLRFRLHARDLPGRPDLVFPRFRAVVHVHGCFWHRHRNCRFAYVPRSNQAFWSNKFQENVQRDRRNDRELRKLGWRIFTLWECQIADPDVLRSLAAEIRKGVS